MPPGAEKDIAMPQKELTYDAAGTRPGRLVAGAAAAVVAISAVAGYLGSAIDIGGFVALLLMLPVVAASYRWPRFGMILFLAYTSTVMAPEFLAGFVDPNTVYWGAEAFLLLLVISSIQTRVKEGPGAFHDFYSSPVAVALTVLGAVIVMKSLVFLIEYHFARSALSQVYTFNRSLAFYALFIPVFLLFNTRRRQRAFLAVLFAMGGIIVARVLLEAALPDLGIFKWISLSQSLSVEFPSVDPLVQRLRAPGGSIVQVCFWMGLMNIILRPWNPRRLAVYVPLTLLMLAGILLEFNRSYVIPIIALTGVAMLLHQRAVRIKLVAVFATIAVLLVITSLLTGTMREYVDAFTERYGSAFSEEVFEAQSLTSREIENDYAWDSIRREPLFGIGINEFYRPPVPGMLDNLRWYIHNAYLWYWTYFGLVGLAALVVAVSIVVFRGFANWKRISDPFLQSGLLAFTFTLLTLAAANFYAPRFYEYATVPVVTVILGLSEAIIFTEKGESPT